MVFTRITTSPRQMGGVACLRSLRIPVATVVGLVAEGQTTQDILALYPDLEAEDVREALLFAAEAVRERALLLAVPTPLWPASRPNVLDERRVGRRVDRDG